MYVYDCALAMTVLFVPLTVLYVPLTFLYVPLTVLYVPSSERGDRLHVRVRLRFWC